LGQLESAFVIGVDERPRLARRQKMDAERRLERDNSALDAGAIEGCKPRAQPMGGEIDREAALDRRQDIAAKEGRRRPSGEQGDEAVRPQVLVEVDDRGGQRRTDSEAEVITGIRMPTIPIRLVGKADTT